MRRIFGRNKWVAVAMMALVVLVAPLAIKAGVDYCWGDPIYQVGPDQVNVNVGIPRAKIPTLLGPVKVVLEVPMGTPARIIFVATEPFVEEAAIVYLPTTKWNPSGTNTVNVKVLVAAAESFPVEVHVTAEGRNSIASGNSNQRIAHSRTLNAAR
jgi:hypothetical protein